MTPVAPPAGTAAVTRPHVGIIEWRVPGPGDATWLEFRVLAPRPEQTNRRGRVLSPAVPARVELRTGIAGFGPDFEDPDTLRAWLWSVLRAGLRLAEILEHGQPAPTDTEPDPQQTMFEPSGAMA